MNIKQPDRKRETSCNILRFLLRERSLLVRICSHAIKKGIDIFFPGTEDSLAVKKQEEEENRLNWTLSYVFKLLTLLLSQLDIWQATKKNRNKHLSHAKFWGFLSPPLHDGSSMVRIGDQAIYIVSLSSNQKWQCFLVILFLQLPYSSFFFCWCQTEYLWIQKLELLLQRREGIQKQKSSPCLNWTQSITHSSPIHNGDIDRGIATTTTRIQEMYRRRCLRVAPQKSITSIQKRHENPLEKSIWKGKKKWLVLLENVWIFLLVFETTPLWRELELRCTVLNGYVTFVLKDSVLGFFCCRRCCCRCYCYLILSNLGQTEAKRKRTDPTQWEQWHWAKVFQDTFPSLGPRVSRDSLLNCISGHCRPWCWRKQSFIRLFLFSVPPSNGICFEKCSCSLTFVWQADFWCLFVRSFVPTCNIEIATQDLGCPKKGDGEPKGKHLFPFLRLLLQNWDASGPNEKKPRELETHRELRISESFRLHWTGIL